jgi:aarF domain-containing kinase
MKRKNIDVKKIGKKFANLMIKMIHQEGFVHADPHSGNLLVCKNSNNEDQLFVLDHGLYQELTAETRESYNWFWLGLILNK